MRTQVPRWLVGPFVAGIIVATAAAVHLVLAAKDPETKPALKPERTGHAEAWFHVPSTTGSILSGEKHLSEEAFQRMCRSQAAAVKSLLVLNDALRNPEVLQLPIVGNQPGDIDAEGPSWLMDALLVEFPERGEYMVIELRLPNASPKDSVTILNAIASAYKENVLDSARSQKRSRSEILALAHNRLNEQLQRAMETYIALAEELNFATTPHDATTQMLLNEINLNQSELLRLEQSMLEFDAKNSSLHRSKLPVNEVPVKPLEGDLAKPPNKPTTEEINENPELRLAAVYAIRISALNKTLDRLKEQLKGRTAPNADLELKQLEINQLKAMLAKFHLVRAEMEVESTRREGIYMMGDATWIASNRNKTSDAIQPVTGAAE